MTLITECAEGATFFHWLAGRDVEVLQPLQQHGARPGRDRGRPSGDDTRGREHPPGRVRQIECLEHPQPRPLQPELLLHRRQVRHPHHRTGGLPRQHPRARRQELVPGRDRLQVQQVPLDLAADMLRLHPRERPDVVLDQVLHDGDAPHVPQGIGEEERDQREDEEPAQQTPPQPAPEGAAADARPSLARACP